MSIHRIYPLIHLLYVPSIWVWLHHANTWIPHYPSTITTIVLLDIDQPRGHHWFDVGIAVTGVHHSRCCWPVIDVLYGDNRRSRLVYMIPCGISSLMWGVQHLQRVHHTPFPHTYGPHNAIANPFVPYRDHSMLRHILCIHSNFRYAKSELST